MSVKKIFMTLIIVVACVILGAFFLNILLPNATTVLVDTVEDMIYNATGLTFDLNGNGFDGSEEGSAEMISNTEDKSAAGAGVNGFE